MVPCFIVDGHDYAEDIAELKPSLNDLDADGSGRNILTGLMYRKLISTKDKWTVTFNRLDETQMRSLIQSINKQYVTVTLLDPKTNTQTPKQYYCSTINPGIQRYLRDGADGKTVYDGATFNITER